MLQQTRIILSIALAMALIAIGSAFSGARGGIISRRISIPSILPKRMWRHTKPSKSAIVAQNPNGAVAVLSHRWLDEEYLMRQEGCKTAMSSRLRLRSLNRSARRRKLTMSISIPRLFSARKSLPIKKRINIKRTRCLSSAKRNFTRTIS